MKGVVSRPSLQRVVAFARVDSRKIMTTLRFSDPVDAKLASSGGGAASSTTVSATRAGSSSLSATSIPVITKLTMESWAKDLLSFVEAPPGSSENENKAYTASPTPKTRNQETSSAGAPS